MSNIHLAGDWTMGSTFPPGQQVGFPEVYLNEGQLQGPLWLVSTVHLPILQAS